MTTLAAPPPATDDKLADAIRGKLKSATTPLKIADVAKGLPRPKKVKPDEFKEGLGAILAEEVRLGRAFSAPSGKDGETRFWSRDERQAVREKVIERASSPQTLSALTKEAGRSVKAADSKFVEALVRDLIGEDRLFEYPPAKKNGGPLFGSNPPPPPPPVLERAQYKKKVDKIVGDCRKLVAETGASFEQLFRLLQTALGDTSAVNGQVRPAPVAPAEVVPVSSGMELEDLILKAVGSSPMLSLAELRQEMPAEFQGKVFDETVLQLFDEERVLINRDASADSFSDAERAAFVQDGRDVFTTISRRS